MGSPRHGTSTPRSRHGRSPDQRHVATDPLEPDAERLWAQVAGRVSHAAMQLRSLRSRHEHRPELARELERIAHELDDVFGSLMRTTVDLTYGPIVTPTASTALEGAHDRFSLWAADGFPERVAGATGWDAQPRQLLRSVSTSPHTLPDEVAGALGAPTGISFGRAAQLLTWAHDAVDGPRCRSYRSAALLLASVDPELLPDPPDGAGPDASDPQRRSTAPRHRLPADAS